MTATAVTPRSTCGSSRSPSANATSSIAPDEVRRREADDEVGLVAVEALEDLARDLADRVRRHRVLGQRRGEARLCHRRSSAPPELDAEPDQADQGARRRGAAIGVRDGRRSSTVTGTSATASPARSARSTSSVSKRSVPLRQRAAIGSTVDAPHRLHPVGVRHPRARSPNRSSVRSPAVIARRGQGRVSRGARCALRADDDRRAVDGGRGAGARRRRSRGRSSRRRRPRRRRPPRRGSRPASPRRSRRPGRVSTDDLGLVGREGRGRRRASVGRAVLDHEHLEASGRGRAARRPAPSASGRGTPPRCRRASPPTPRARRRAPEAVGDMTVGYRPFHGPPHAARRRERRPRPR